MSALGSKHVSKGNLTISFNNNNPKSTHRNKQKNQKIINKYSSSALSNKQQPMQVTFQKTGEKLKKNLSKQFQTFNINNDDKQKIFHKEGAKSNPKHLSNQKEHKLKTQTQITTQAKSPLVKSNLSSKTKLSQYQQKDQISQSKSKIKQSLKKQRERSRSKSPASSNKSRKSSPQVLPSHSKLSGTSSKKRVFSKAKLSTTSHNILQKFSQQSNKIEKSSFLKNKSRQQNQLNSQRNDYLINFPQLITQSQSLYPSSSYPNTGKESQNYEKMNYSKEEDNNNNSHILQQEEDETQYIQSQETEEDYISEGGNGEEMDSGINMRLESKQIYQHSKFNDKTKSTSYGYQQLPQSYITAMQILQKKLEQHQYTISKLHKQIGFQNTQYSKLQNHCKSLESQLDNKSTIISEKDAEIKFLKGYLNEEKNNNRQALKEVAKNVYQRTLLSTKKEIKTIKIDHNEEINIDKGRKQKRRLFENSEMKYYDQQNDAQCTENDHITKPDLIQKLIAPQIQHQKQVNQGLERQRKMKEELFKQELIKDEMMRSQILRQQILLNKVEGKRFQYLQEKEKQHLKGISSSRVRNNEDVSGNKRMRSISTVVKPNEKQEVRQQTTSRPRNVSFSEAPNFRDYSNRKFSYERTPLKSQQLKDPVLERYIHAKSQLSSHPYAYNLTSSKHNIPNHYEIAQGHEQLKNEKRNKQVVSKMRQLMRAEKQLIALNYKLQAFEKKILNVVQSTSSQDQINRRPQQQRQTENLLLEDLQKQYSMTKKEFEKKELVVKQLKNSLQGSV